MRLGQVVENGRGVEASEVEAEVNDVLVPGEEKYGTRRRRGGGGGGGGAQGGGNNVEVDGPMHVGYAN